MQMPWHLESDNPGCSGWAVVKTDTGKVVGCHKTKGDAQSQLDALHANVKDYSMAQEQEQRVYPILRVMVERSRDNSAGRFTGHAAVFNQRTSIGDPQRGGFYEQLDKAAFNRALAEEHDVRFLVDHDPSRVLARTASGTLNLSTDKQGLRVDADLADTSIGRDLRVLLERGDVSQMSFGFVVREDEWAMQKDGTELRTIRDLDLYDVSAVTFPAYPQTDAAIRAAGYYDIRRQRWEAMSARLPKDPGLPG